MRKRPREQKAKDAKRRYQRRRENGFCTRCTERSSRSLCTKCREKRKKLEVRRKGDKELLTPKQKRLARMIRDGFTNCEILTILGISRSTYLSTRKNIFRKLMVRNECELVAILLLPLDSSLVERRN